MDRKKNGFVASREGILVSVRSKRPDVHWPHLSTSPTNWRRAGSSERLPEKEIGISHCKSSSLIGLCWSESPPTEPIRRVFPPPSSIATIAPQPDEPCRNAPTSDHRAKAGGGMRLDPVHLSMLVIGVSFACYSPSLNSLQDQAYKSAVVIEGKVQSAVPANVSSSSSSSGSLAEEPHSVHSVRVLDVWPVNSGGLEREQLVTYVGEFGSESQQPSSSSSPSSSCDAKVIANHKYIFFMDPTDEPLVFKASFAPLDTSGKNLKKDVCSRTQPQSPIRLSQKSCPSSSVPTMACSSATKRQYKIRLSRSSEERPRQVRENGPSWNVRAVPPLRRGQSMFL
ncbi:unnamed protein product [Gadus morhua 'NCC']